MRETWDIWPPLPIEIDLVGSYDVDNIIATLERRDRVRDIRVHDLSSSQLKRLAPIMQEPFPALTCLQLSAQTVTGAS